MKNSQRRNWPLALLILVVLGGAAWWWVTNNEGRRGNDPGRLATTSAHKAKAKAVKMTLKVASTAITGIENGRIEGTSQVVLTNPLPVPLHASRLDYATVINGQKVSEGSYTKPIEIPASGSKTLALPMELLIEPMEKVIDEMKAAGEDTATYTFINTIHTDVPVAGERKISFNIRERLPVVRPPKMKPGKLDIEDVGLKDSEMSMTMQVTNPNSFPITIKDGSYSVTIDEKNTLEGALQEAVQLPAKETVPVTMHLEAKTGRALKMGWKMLFDQKDTRYELTFDGKVVSNEKMLRHSTMHVREEGTLEDLKQAVKGKE